MNISALVGILRIVLDDFSATSNMLHEADFLKLIFE